MELILWRHADAEYGPPDMERALTPKGLKQAERMGDWLARHLPDTCRILVSPAKRAIQTADGMKRKYRIMAELAPDAAPESLLLAANWPHRKEPVLLVGHQPTLGQVASLLLADTQQDWNIRKGNIWWFAQRENETGLETWLKLALAPDFVSK